MTEFVELVALSQHIEDNPKCPFCPGVEEPEWKTYTGKENSSKELRACMNNPDRNDYSQQNTSGAARPKDKGVEKTPHDKKTQQFRQSPDENDISPGEKETPPIFHMDKYGPYRNEAHHCISGNEIMKGHAIERVITKNSRFKKDTGYTINNAANGVYLPSFPKAYRGIWGKKWSGSESVSSKTYPVYDGSDPKVITSKEDDNNFKYEIMKEAMKAGKGQAHIGSHGGFYIEDLDEYNVSYPKVIKKELSAIFRRVVNMGKDCPFCVNTKGEPQKPFLPPYKVNQWLDDLAKSIKNDLVAAPDTWKYFISAIARDYFVEMHLPEILKTEEEFTS